MEMLPICHSECVTDVSARVNNRNIEAGNVATEPTGG